jgi:hypothetical protein
MRTLKSTLFAILVVLFAASVVITLLWGVSNSGLADRLRQALGHAPVAARTDVTPGVASVSSQASIRTAASFVRITLLAFLKVIFLMGLPGVVTVIIVNRLKLHPRQPDEES